MKCANMYWRVHDIIKSYPLPSTDKRVCIGLFYTYRGAGGVVQSAAVIDTP